MSRKIVVILFALLALSGLSMLQSPQRVKGAVEWYGDLQVTTDCEKIYTSMNPADWPTGVSFKSLDDGVTTVYDWNAEFSWNGRSDVTITGKIMWTTGESWQGTKQVSRPACPTETPVDTPTATPENTPTEQVKECPIGYLEIKFDSPFTAETIGPITVKNVVIMDGEPVQFDWVSTELVYFVFVKGGPTTNDYEYPEGSFGDNGLVASDNKGISNVVFCYLKPTITPTPTSTPTPTDTPSATPTETDTPTGTQTPSPTPTSTSSPAPTPPTADTPTPEPQQHWFYLPIGNGEPIPTPVPAPTITPTPVPSYLECREGFDPHIAFEGRSNGLVPFRQIPKGTWHLERWDSTVYGPVDVLVDALIVNGQPVIQVLQRSVQYNGTYQVYVQEVLNVNTDRELHDGDEFFGDGWGIRVTSVPFGVKATNFWYPDGLGIQYQFAVGTTGLLAERCTTLAKQGANSAASQQLLQDYFFEQ